MGKNKEGTEEMVEGGKINRITIAEVSQLWV